MIGKRNVLRCAALLLVSMLLFTTVTFSPASAQEDGKKESAETEPLSLSLSLCAAEGTKVGTIGDETYYAGDVYVCVEAFVLEGESEEEKAKGSGDDPSEGDNEPNAKEAEPETDSEEDDSETKVTSEPDSEEDGLGSKAKGAEADPKTEAENEAEAESTKAESETESEEEENPNESQPYQNGIDVISYLLTDADQEKEDLNWDEAAVMYQYEDGDPLFALQLQSPRLSADNGDYRFFVRLCDRLGHTWLNSVVIHFCQTQILVSIDGKPDPLAAEGAFFRQKRTVTITITERADLFAEEGLSITFDEKPGTFAVEDVAFVKSGAQDRVITAETSLCFSTEGTYDWHFTYIDRAGFVFCGGADGTSPSTEVQTAKDSGPDPYHFTYDATGAMGYVTVSYLYEQNGETQMGELSYENPDGSDGGYASPLSVLHFTLWAQEVEKAEAVVWDTTPAGEEGSGVRAAAYHKSAQTTPLSEEELIDLPDEEWNSGEAWEKEIANTANESFVIYVRLIDNAGNISYLSSDGGTADTLKPVVSLSADTDGRTENGWYTSDVTLHLLVQDTDELQTEEEEIHNTSSGLSSVICRVYACLLGEEGKEQRSLVWQEKLSPKEEDQTRCNDQTGSVCLWQRDVVVPSDAAADAAYLCVSAVAYDRAGNASEAAEQILYVDDVSPVITVTYDSDEAQNGRYFSRERTAEIKITERSENFTGENVRLSLFACDADGEALPLLDLITVTDEKEKPLAYLAEPQPDGVVLLSVLGAFTEEKGKTPNEDTHTIRIRFGGDANYTFDVSFSDDVGNAAEGFISSSVAPGAFTIDLSPPAGSRKQADGCCITVGGMQFFGEWAAGDLPFSLIRKTSVTAELFGCDDTSPIRMDVLTLSEADGTIREGCGLSGEELSAVSESRWQTLGSVYRASSLSESLSFTDDRQILYLRITDAAGNVTFVGTEGIISDPQAPRIDLLAQEPDLDNGDLNVYGIYNEKSGDFVSVDVFVSDETMAGAGSCGLRRVSYTVTSDGVLTQKGDLFTAEDNGWGADGAAAPRYRDLQSTFFGTVSVDTKKNDSASVVVCVTAEDRAGYTTQESVTLDIDVTPPAVTISYDNNQAQCGSYFSAARTAEIVVTERDDHFDASSATEGIQISATDALGRSLAGGGAACRISEWKSVKNEGEEAHTAKIAFLSDANYTLSFSYTDRAGNVSSAVTPEPGTAAPFAFTVDTKAPDASVTAVSGEGESRTWRTLAENFDFSFCSGSEMKLSAAVSDETSPVQSVCCYLSAEERVLNEEELSALPADAWRPYEAFSVTDDAEFILYVKVADAAGNCRYISTDGIFVDKTAPKITVTFDPPEAETNPYYSAARTARITITEAHFDPSSTDISVSPANAVSVGPFVCEGESHTASVVFSGEEAYGLKVTCTDLAQNEAQPYESGLFVLDRTEPLITIEGVENEAAYADDFVRFSVCVTDENYSSEDVAISLKGLRYGKTAAISQETVENGEVFSSENITQDDIYILTVTAKDKAGNRAQTSLRFSVNRCGSTYDIGALLNINGCYLTADRMTDLIITEINPNRLRKRSVTIYRNTEKAVLTEGTDYKVKEEIGEGGWYYYTYTIFRFAFLDDALYAVRLTSLDEANNASANILDGREADIRFVVDNTPPVLIVTNLSNGLIVNAFSYDVFLTADDNFLLHDVSVFLDDGTQADAVFSYEEGSLLQDHFLKYSLKESSGRQKVTFCATDMAGNETEVICGNITVSTKAGVRFLRRFALVARTASAIGTVLVLLLLVLFLIRRRKRRKGNT